jgi:hypothetical protein
MEGARATGGLAYLEKKIVLVFKNLHGPLVNFARALVEGTVALVALNPRALLAGPEVPAEHDPLLLDTPLIAVTAQED